ncbi:hypothetical protein D3C78_1742270 [compost metagenome]
MTLHIINVLLRLLGKLLNSWAEVNSSRNPRLDRRLQTHHSTDEARLIVQKDISFNSIPEIIIKMSDSRHKGGILLMSEPFHR